MDAMARQPALRWIRQWWFVWPTLALASWGLGGELGRDLLLAVLLATAVALLLAAARVLWQSGMVGLSWSRHRRRESWRFVCPECLAIGPFHYACGACRKPLEAFVVQTGGQYVATCGHCGEEVFPVGSAPQVLARCGHCQQTAPTGPYHARRVVVGAALSESAWQHWQEGTVLARREQDGLEFVVLDERPDLLVGWRAHANLDGAVAPAGQHALWDLRTLRTGVNPASEFEVPATVDALRRLAEQWGRGAGWLQRCQVGLETVVPPAVRDRLSHFFARVEGPPHER